MKKSLAGVALTLLALAAPALDAVDLKPLSAQDKAKLEELLKSFDPATFDIRFQYFDEHGAIKNAKLGRAVGLGSVRQGQTKKPPQPETVIPLLGRGPACASQLGPNQTINGFADTVIITRNSTYDVQKSKLNELNALLQKYQR